MLALHGSPSRTKRPYGAATVGDADFITRNVNYLLSTGASTVLVSTVRQHNRRKDFEKVWSILPNRRKHLDSSAGCRVSFDGQGAASIDELAADYQRMTAFGWIVIVAIYPHGELS